MSIILKGVNMPNSGQIELIIRPHGKVFSKTRGIYAEAIQISKDHGRLIDADAFERRCMFDSQIEDMQDTIYALRDYPTILDKERE